MVGLEKWKLADSLYHDVDLWGRYYEIVRLVPKRIPRFLTIFETEKGVPRTKGPLMKSLLTKMCVFAIVLHKRLSFSQGNTGFKHVEIMV